MKTYYKGYYVDQNGAVIDKNGDVVNFSYNLNDAKQIIDKLLNE